MQTHMHMLKYKQCCVQHARQEAQHEQRHQADWARCMSKVKLPAVMVAKNSY